MKFTKVTYSKLFPLQQFSNERIEVEIQIDDHESEMAALELAKKTVLRFHEQSVKQDESKNVKDISDDLPKSQKNVIEQILNCKTMPELREWEIYVNSKNGQSLKGIYEQREKQIKNGN